ncbi:diphosphomevalonate decarboxylase [Coemansia spiralis]|nr:diphosphomevalonate decarboxylase [Coemansia spiralis]
MNDTSRAIVALVHAFNAAVGRTAAAYTYDAGPNAVIYALESDMRDLVELFAYCFPRAEDCAPDAFYPDPFGLFESLASVGQHVSAPKVAELAHTAGQSPAGSVRRIIHTTVGDGPRLLPASQSLLDAAGLPRAARD